VCSLGFSDDDRSLPALVNFLLQVVDLVLEVLDSRSFTCCFFAFPSRRLKLLR